MDKHQMTIGHQHVVNLTGLVGLYYKTLTAISAMSDIGWGRRRLSHQRAYHHTVEYLMFKAPTLVPYLSTYLTL